MFPHEVEQLSGLSSAGGRLNLHANYVRALVRTPGLVHSPEYPTSNFSALTYKNESAYLHLHTRKIRSRTKSNLESYKPQNWVWVFSREFGDGALQCVVFFVSLRASGALEYDPLANKEKKRERNSIESTQERNHCAAVLINNAESGSRETIITIIEEQMVAFYSILVTITFFL